MGSGRAWTRSAPPDPAQLTVVVELPGIAPDSIQLVVDEHTLLVAG